VPDLFTFTPPFSPALLQKPFAYRAFDFNISVIGIKYSVIAVRAADNVLFLTHLPSPPASLAL